MPSNVEVVRGLFEAVSRRDYDAAALALDPDAEWHNTAAFPGPRIVRGARAICRFWEDMFDSYGGGSGGLAGMEIERVKEGDDVVVVLIHGWWRARGDVPLEARWAQTFWLRDAKILRGEAHGQYGTALQAAGLRE
jgi:ketosteroid isomerase-like protein